MSSETKLALIAISLIVMATAAQTIETEYEWEKKPAIGPYALDCQPGELVTIVDGWLVCKEVFKRKCGYKPDDFKPVDGFRCSKTCNCLFVLQSPGSEED